MTSLEEEWDGTSAEKNGSPLQGGLSVDCHLLVYLLFVCSHPIISEPVDLNKVRKPIRYEDFRTTTYCKENTETSHELPFRFVSVATEAYELRVGIEGATRYSGTHYTHALGHPQTEDYAGPFRFNGCMPLGMKCTYAM